MTQRKNSSLSNAKPNKPWVSKGGVSTPDTKDSGSKIYKVKNNPGELRNNKNNKNISGFQTGQPVKPNNSAKNSKKKSRKQKSKLKTRKQKTRKNKKLQNRLQKEAFAKKALFTKRKKKVRQESFSLHRSVVKKEEKISLLAENQDNHTILYIPPEKEKKRKKRKLRKGEKNDKNNRRPVRNVRTHRNPGNRNQNTNPQRSRPNPRRSRHSPAGTHVSRQFVRVGHLSRTAVYQLYRGFNRFKTQRAAQRINRRLNTANSQPNNNLLKAVKDEGRTDRKVIKFLLKSTAKTVGGVSSFAIQTTTDQMSQKAKVAAAPAISLLKASASSLRKPKQTHKHIAKEAKNLFKSQLSDDVSHAVSSVSTSGRIVKKPVTVPVKTVIGD